MIAQSFFFVPRCNLQQCSPQFGDIVASLNAGLVAAKVDAAFWEALRDKWTSIGCDMSSTTFANDGASPYVAHPSVRADVAIMAEA